MGGASACEDGGEPCDIVDLGEQLRRPTHTQGRPLRKQGSRAGARS